MPTGFTDTIKDGISFEEYALKCAGFFIRTTAAKPPTHCKERLEKEKQKIAQLVSSTEVERIKLLKEAYIKDLIYFVKKHKEKRLLKYAYVKMLKKVKDYTPPTKEHIVFKTFMQDQIEKSIDADCNNTYPLRPEYPIYIEWFEKQLTELTANIIFYSKEAIKEKQKYSERNEWYNQLLTSIKETNE